MNKVKDLLSGCDLHKLLGVLYSEFIILIAMIFLAVPLWVFPVILILQIPMISKLKSSKSFLPYSILYVVFLCAFGYFTSSIFYRFLMISVASVIVLYIRKFGKKDREDNKEVIDYIRSVLTLSMPFLVTLLIESMQGNIILVLKYLFCSRICGFSDTYLPNHVVYCFSIVLIWVVNFFFTLLFKKKKIGTLCTIIPIFLLSTVNMFVVRITGSPFIPSDILNAGTAFNSVKNQNIFSGVLLIGLFFIVLEILFIYVICRVYGDSEICLAKWNRIVQSFIYGLCIVMMISYVGSLDLLNFKGNLAYGYVLYFINCFGDFSIDEPEGYYKVDIDTSSGIDSVDSVEASESNPNVVIVMSEAFSDLASVYDLEFNEDPIPYFHSLQSQYLNGTVYSSVLGNNTVSSEFECLTGISTGFSAKGSDVYQNFWKGREDIFTVANLFEDKGYSSVFIHPCVGENYNRSNIYSQLGYEDTVFLEDFDEDVDKLRTFVTDEAVFSEILNTLQDTDESTFLMSITMQNHGRYNDEFEIDPRIELRNMQGEYEDVENYLSLLKKSDGALKDFLNSLDDLKEPTVVLFFGDHQPMVDYSFYSECVGVDYNSMGVSDKESLYKIPYLLWSNYDISSDYEVPEITSMNYLSLILNNYLGNTNSEWLNLLKDVQKYYPVITENFVINNYGEILGIGDIKQFILSDNSKSSEILRKYWYACYSFIAGNK